MIEKILLAKKEAILKYGTCNHSPIIWASILAQEVGEVNKEAMTLECNEKYYQLPEDEILDRYESELLQVGATVLNALESLYRNEKRSE